jgi:hypothetical protein
MSSTERNLRRMSRLAATEVAAEDTTERLWRLHRDLADAELPEWAARLSEIIQIDALKAAAEYTRRTSAFFCEKRTRNAEP